MPSLFGKPLVFKSFLLGFHAAKYWEYLTKSCFVYVKRDFLDNAFSIFKMRRELVGNEEKWVSILPRQYDEMKAMDKYHQVAGQILFLNHEYQKQLEQLPEQNVLVTDYQSICDNPCQFIDNVQSLLSSHSKIEIRQNVDIRLNSSSNKNYSQEKMAALLEARDYWFAQHPELKTYNT